MEQTNNKLPELPTDISFEIQKRIELYRIKAAEKYAEKDFLLERDGVGFAPRGNVCAIAAEKKAGKTWLGMAMSAALLRGDFLGMKARSENSKVLFFDTEQDAGDGQRIQKRVHFVNGWDFNTDHDEFQLFHLREISATERRKFVNDAIEYLKPDMVIVDGIRDLLQDFNDLQESASVIQDFMRISSEQNCCIWAVLHVNPNSDKMRGHLGTELGNKVADILLMTKKKNPQDEDDVTYKMEETDARGHKDIHSITFRIDDNQPFGMPVLVGEDEVKQMDEDIVEHEKQEVDSIIKKYLHPPLSVSWTKLRDEIRTGEKIGQTKAGNIVNKALEYEILITHSNRKMTYNGLNAVKKPEPMPFEPPTENDKPPF